MADERDQITQQILALDQHIYEYLRRGIGSTWIDVDLTMPQLKMLFLAAGPTPLRASQIAQALGMTLPTATGVADRLVAQGLVQRSPDPRDRRIVLLRATPEGAALMDRLLSAKKAYLRSILDRLSLEELRVVARGLDLLHEATMSMVGPAEAGQTGD